MEKYFSGFMSSDSIMFCKFSAVLFNLSLMLRLAVLSLTVINVLNLRRLFNSMCKRINQIVLFNLRKYFKIKNVVIFRYLKENFILGGTPLFIIVRLICWKMFLRIPTMMLLCHSVFHMVFQLSTETPKQITSFQVSQGCI